MQLEKGIYRQRHPEQTACYKIFQGHYKGFRDSDLPPENWSTFKVRDGIGQVQPVED